MASLVRSGPLSLPRPCPPPGELPPINALRLHCGQALGEQIERPCRGMVWLADSVGTLGTSPLPFVLDTA